MINGDLKIPFILLLIGFVGVAVFGVFGMDHGEDHVSNCLAAAASGLDCPTEGNAASSVAFHIGAFKQFSLAPLATDLFLIFSLLGISFGFVKSFALPRLASFVRRSHERGRSFIATFCYELITWLSFHENSPALV